MKIVDASVLVGLLLGQPGPVEALLTATDDDEPLQCPALVQPEALSALRGMERGGRLTRAQANRAVQDLGDVRMVLHPFGFGGRTGRRAWELRHNLSIYDASYLALAELLDGSVLLTADAGLAGVARASLGEARVQVVA